MANRLEASSAIWIVPLLAAVVAVTLIAVIKAGELDVAMLKEHLRRPQVEEKVKRPVSTVPLAENIRLNGYFDKEDLFLSTREVRRINRSLARYSELFAKLDVQVNPVDQFHEGEVEMDTKLSVGMLLELQSQRVVERVPQKVPRRHLAPHVERLMEEAAEVYEFYDRLPETKGFRKIYL